MLCGEEGTFKQTLAFIFLFRICLPERLLTYQTAASAEWVLPIILLLMNLHAKGSVGNYAMLITKPVVIWADSRERAVMLNKSVPPFVMHKI